MHYLHDSPYESLGDPFPGLETRACLSPDDLVTEITSVVAAGSPYSHLRLGDGEASLLLVASNPLRYRERRYAGSYRWKMGERALTTGASPTDEPFIAALCQAYRNADSIGLLALGEDGLLFDGYYLTDSSGLNMTVEALQIAMVVPSEMIGTEVRAIYQVIADGRLFESLGSASCLLVGSASNDVALLSKLPSWRKRHHWCLEATSFPTKRRLMRDALPVANAVLEKWLVERQDIVLVGCGAPGKVICNVLRNFGAVAIDIGEAMEALRGTGDRHRPFLGDLAAKTLRADMAAIGR